jgi:hypothetical protein
VAERTRRRVTMYLIPFLFCLYILAYLDRVNVAGSGRCFIRVRVPRRQE